MAVIFAAIGSAVAAGAGAAGIGAGAAAAGSAAVGISQALSVGSALASIGQGIMTRNRLQTEAIFAKTEAAQEQAAGANRERDLAKEYAALRSEQQVVQLANGLDIGTGTPVSIADATRREADRNLSLNRSNTANRVSMARLRSRGLMSDANAALIGGVVGAAETGLNAFQLTG
jgi:hypothetical protein